MPSNSQDFLIPTRFFMQTKIERPFDVGSSFVYNYFTPDEASDEDLVLNEKSPSFSSYVNKDQSGNPYTFDSDNKKIVFVNGKQSTEDVLRRISPRFVEVSWNHKVNVPAVTLEDVTLKELDESNKIIREEDISSFYDSNLRFFDPTIRERLVRKLNLMRHFSLPSPESTVPKSYQAASTLVGEFGYERVGAEALSADMSEQLADLVDYNTPIENQRVNDLGEDENIQTFEKAASMMFEFDYDRRLLPVAAKSPTVHQRGFLRKLREYSKNDAGNRSLLPKEPSKTGYFTAEDAEFDVNLETPTIPCEIIDEEIKEFSSDIKRVGYIIERYDSTKGIDLDSPTRLFYSGEPINSNFIDREVRYGKKYYYTVRTVYRRIFSDEAFADGKSLGLKAMRQYIASRPSPATYVETIERIPPKEPDGLFYKFDYTNKGGLILHWQYPVGRQRDTKYFQVFRRKSIHEPFTCIAEIDFNDALVKTPKREIVKNSRRYTFSNVRTFYEDYDFNRDSSFIYAVASVDAHGLTSGYSAQSRVTFNRNTNKIELKTVSRAGSPKQYPNFFVDPQEDETLNVFSLTQDSMTTSGYSKVKVYMDSAARFYESNQIEKTAHTAMRSPGDTTGPLYKIHMINLDRQKDDSIHVIITDFTED